jgi:hypothetical protein
MMAAILNTLEKLLERRPQQETDPPLAEQAPYPDASKAVESFKLKLAQRIRAGRNQTQALKQG